MNMEKFPRPLSPEDFDIDNEDDYDDDE